MNYAIATSILWPAEKFINLLIESDSHGKKLLASFSGKSIEIETFLPNLRLTIKFSDGSIRLIGFEKKLVSTPADVKISGDFDKLLRLLMVRKKYGFFNQKYKGCWRL